MSVKTRIVAGVALLLICMSGAAAYLWFSGARGAVKLAAAEKRQCRVDTADATDPHAGMVYVPGGKFTLGDTVYPEEGPIKTVEVSGFWMDRHEVTNRQFKAFVDATDYVTVAERPVDAARHPGLPSEMLKPGSVVFIMPNDVNGMGDVTQWWRYVPGANWRHPGGPDTSIEGFADFPVVDLAFEDILAYAKWKGHDIPTEAQWEWAARGGQAEAARDHDQPTDANTWQGIFPVQNSAADGFVGLAPAGCYKPNAYGLHDMVGNAWEWTKDLYQPNHDGAGGLDPAGPPEGFHPDAGDVDRHVIKGGSYLCAPNYCMRYRAGSRQPQEADLGTSHVGFRTVRKE